MITGKKQKRNDMEWIADLLAVLKGYDSDAAGNNFCTSIVVFDLENKRKATDAVCEYFIF